MSVTFKPTSQYYNNINTIVNPYVGTAKQTKAYTYTATAAKPTEFFPPDTIEKYYPKWASEKATLEDNWLILQAPADYKKSHRELINDRDYPGVFFTPRVFNEMTYVVESLAPKTGECAMFALVKRVAPERPQWLVYDWFLSKQTASSAEVKLDVPDFNRYFKYIMEKNPNIFKTERDLHNSLMHAHSHHTMNMCSWSGTDMNQQTSPEELARQGDYRIFFLFTIGHGLKATMVNYSTGLTRQEMYIGLCFSEPEYVVSLTNKRKKVLDKQMDELVNKSVAYKTTFTPGFNITCEPKPTTPTPTRKVDTESEFMLTDDDYFDWAEAAEKYSVVSSEKKPEDPISFMDMLEVDHLVSVELVISKMAVAFTKALEVEMYTLLKSCNLTEKEVDSYLAQRSFDKVIDNSDISAYLYYFNKGNFEFDSTSTSLEGLSEAVAKVSLLYYVIENSIGTLTADDIDSLIDEVSEMAEAIAILLSEMSAIHIHTQGIPTVEFLTRLAEMNHTVNEYIPEDFSDIAELINKKNPEDPSIVEKFKAILSMYTLVA